MVVRSRIPNSVSLDKSNIFFLFCVYFFVCAIRCLKIECCGRLSAQVRSRCVRVWVKFANCNFFFVCNGLAVPLAITPNNDSMNRLLRIHNRRFLRRVSARTVVFQHSTGEHVSLNRPRSEIYVQENIFVVSFHHFSALLSN